MLSNFGGTLSMITRQVTIRRINTKMINGGWSHGNALVMPALSRHDPAGVFRL